MTESPPLILVVIPWVLSSVVLSSIVTAIVTWRLGVRGDERAARKDETDAADKLLGRALERLNTLENRVDVLEQNARKDAQTILDQERHIDVLEQWVYDGKPPPPPLRPQRV